MKVQRREDLRQWTSRRHSCRHSGRKLLISPTNRKVYRNDIPEAAGRDDADCAAHPVGRAERRLRYGELAQLARAPALHAGGQRFESVILHREQRSLT